MSDLSRRDFVKQTVVAAVALQVPSAIRSLGETAVSAASPALDVELHWLDGDVPPLETGTTWGVPWPRGLFKQQQSFSLQTESGAVLPVQSWPLAYWPDGTLKWTAHAAPEARHAGKLRLSPGTPATPGKAVSVNETAEAIEIDTGVIRCRIPKRGAMLIETIERDGKSIAKNGRLVALSQSQPEPDSDGILRQEKFTSELSGVTIEQRGPVRAVVKLEGKHQGGANKRAWLPFNLRLYFYAGGESVRIMHSFVFDGDEQKDFIRGLGVRFEVPMRDLLHDRHVRFAGEGRGLWAEGVRNLTGLRRDAGDAVKSAQLAGTACPPVEEFPEAVKKRLNLIPAWGDFTLSQSGPDSFEVRKRTKPGCGWIKADNGGRASGLGYIGGVGGGVAFGLRDFWPRYPTQLDIRGATTEAAEVTLWMWSPDAPAMDLRFYHDGMGMETHTQELEGLEITYEDYEKGFGTPHGIARSSEITLWALAATPPRERLADMAAAVRVPPMLACEPAHLHATQVFAGSIWSLPDRSTPVKTRIEDQLDWRISFYQKQIAQRHWFGFWNYGDVMHTYDKDRHVWRYDVGGFAWDNSELSPDLWLWYSYLRSGRADIFRMAEAMTRHTSEVDIYHLGRFAGLGTRHGVQHWGDSAKQVRISTSIYRRFYYFLTGDERVGDVMREVVDSDHKVADFDPVRKIGGPKPTDYPARVSVGTDWCSFASNWLTEWERTGSTKYRDKIVNGMKDIGKATHGFFSGDRFGYDPGAEDGHLYNVLGDKVSASHLSAVFGAMELCAELILLLDVPEFEKAWLQYCELYNAPKEEQVTALGTVHGGTNAIYVGHSRLTAYAAWKKKDAKLAERAWREFSGDGRRSAPELKTERIEGPAVLNPIDEAPWISTNESAQWGLAAIQNLALIGDALAGG